VNDLERSSRDTLGLISRNFPGGAEEK